MRNEENPLSRADGLEGIGIDSSRLRGLSPKGVEAFSWALWGFEVLPSSGKIPLTPNGFYNASSDLAQVVQWWRRWPMANIGARPPRWAVVLDVDVKGGGVETWKSLNAGRLDYHETLVTNTGGGGRHYWYRLPHDGELNGHAGPGIDVRHHKTQVTMPGSIHPDTGRAYTLRQWCDPAALPVLPKHLQRHVYRPAAPKYTPPPKNLFNSNAMASRLVDAVANAPSGERNDTLYAKAFAAAANGLDIFEELEAAAMHAGLSQREAIGTINSARRGAAEKGAAA